MGPTIVGASTASPAVTPGGGSRQQQRQQQQQQHRSSIPGSSRSSSFGASPAGSTASSGGSASQKKQESGLICRVRYCNSLPDIPFDPKFLAYPFEANRFVKYNTTSLEKEYKHELLTELDLGIDIDLVNPDTYRTPVLAKPEPEDEALVADETGPGGIHQRASRHDKMKASWLRKTEYISNEANRQNQVFSDKIESKINLKNKVFSEAEDIYKTKEKQIEAIEKTFEATRRPVEEHYSKRGVHAVQVMPLLPDFHLWQHPCAQVIFDSDPAPKDLAGVSDDVTQAMIRGMVDESGDQFVAYFLPTRETRAKRKRDQEAGMPYVAEEVYEYELSREYNWNVKNKSMKGYDENYFFVFREGGVYYNELETRVRLSKRRKIGMPGGAPTTKTKLVVRHRDFNPAELADRTARLSALEPPEEVEEDDEDEDDDDDEEDDEEEDAAEGATAGRGAEAAAEESEIEEEASEEEEDIPADD